ncbi:MAG: hypothetical protein Q9226_006791 [Calogaya cf. arnoldii]
MKTVAESVSIRFEDIMHWQHLAVFACGLVHRAIIFSKYSLMIGSTRGILALEKKPLMLFRRAVCLIVNYGNDGIGGCRGEMSIDEAWVVEVDLVRIDAHNPT